MLLSQINYAGWQYRGACEGAGVSLTMLGTWRRGEANTARFLMRFIGAPTDTNGVAGELFNFIAHFLRDGSGGSATAAAQKIYAYFVHPLLVSLYAVSTLRICGL